MRLERSHGEMLGVERLMTEKSMAAAEEVEDDGGNNGGSGSC